MKERPQVYADHIITTQSGDEHYKLITDPTNISELRRICPPCPLNGGNEGTEIICTGERILTKADHPDYEDVTDTENHVSIAMTFADGQKVASCELIFGPPPSVEQEPPKKGSIFNIQTSGSCHPCDVIL